LLAVFASLLFLSSLAPASWAGSKDLTAIWQQTLPSPNDLEKWELEYSQDQVAWTKHSDILFVSEQTEYTCDVPFTSPDGQKVTWYFRLRAVDTSGNASDWSNVASCEIDFESPGEPTIFSVTIKVVSE
jgi:hypothetical protein